MARVTVEDCIDKVDNRFDLVLMASHRARAISSGAPISVQRDNDKNPVVALREIGDGKLSPGDLREDVIHALQKHVEIDEPEAEAAPPMVNPDLPDPDRAWRRCSVRPHDGRGFAARTRGPDAAAGAGGRWRVAAADLRACRCGAAASRRMIPSAWLGAAGFFLPLSTATLKFRVFPIFSGGRFAILATESLALRISAALAEPSGWSQSRRARGSRAARMYSRRVEWGPN